MPVIVGQIKTTEAINAVKKIKNATRREVHDINTEIPEEFLIKRAYMQTKDFLNDVHNSRMLSMIDVLMNFRDDVTETVQMLNRKHQANILTQGINGYTRLVHTLNKNPKLHFSEKPSMTYDNDVKYSVMREMVHDFSKDVRKKINKLNKYFEQNF